MKIRKSNQECFPIDASFKAGNGVEYRRVIVPVAQTKSSHRGVILTVRVDNLVKGD